MKMPAKYCTLSAAALTLFVCSSVSIAAADQPVEPSPVGQLVSGLNPLNWKMPQLRMPNFRQLLPGNDETARIKKKKDGLFDEVGKTASNSWNKTKEALNPQNLNPVKFFPASARTNTQSQSVEKKPGFFRSLFAPAPTEIDNSNTVPDFLAQDRPTP